MAAPKQDQVAPSATFHGLSYISKCGQQLKPVCAFHGRNDFNALGLVALGGEKRLQTRHGWANLIEFGKLRSILNGGFGGAVLRERANDHDGSCVFPELDHSENDAPKVELMPA